jgi:hypothetical protein
MFEKAIPEIGIKSPTGEFRRKAHSQCGSQKPAREEKKRNQAREEKGDTFLARISQKIKLWQVRMKKNDTVRRKMW